MALPAAPAAFAFLLALALPAAAEDSGELAEHLIRLRGEVEQLNGELELLRQQQRTTLAGLAAQRAELAAQRDRQQLAARELRHQLEGARAAASAAGLAGDELRPVLEAALDRLQAHIQAGLPFKRAERQAAVAELQMLLANGALPPQRAVNRLWALYEDELRLTRDNSLHSQTIALDGQQVLAEVAKLGTVALYFRTADGRVGQALRGPRGWGFARFEDAQAIARVQAVFDALGKQIRQGWFELPLAGAAP
jgi:hypothetical protein